MRCSETGDAGDERVLLFLQADFASINVTASSEGGAVVNIPSNRAGNSAIQ